MKKSIISLLFFFAVYAFSPNIVFAQAPIIPIEMGIDTQNLDFGKVIVGTTKSLQFRIGNANVLMPKQLHINWSTINQPFSISPVGSFVLQSGQVKLFTITFNPTAAIRYDQTNTLSNNATSISDYSTNHAAINGGPQLNIHFIGIGITGTPQQKQEKAQ
jgi:hypothetical protein